MSFKVRDAHWELMVSFMEDHPSLATGRYSGPNGRATMKMLWADLSHKLNALGYGERSPDKWQKTWTDQKYLIKKKASSHKIDMNATGGGPPNEAPLSRYEKRLLQILGDSFYKGAGSTEIAVAKPSTSEATQSKTLESITQGPQALEYQDNEHCYSLQPPPKKRKIRIEDQYAETITILKEIKNTVSSGLEKVASSIDRMTAAIVNNQTK